MNEDELRALIERGWAAIRGGDVETLVDMSTEDVELRPPSFWLDGVTFVGHEGVREWFRRQVESWSSLGGAPHVLAAAADRAAVAVDVRAVGHESGVPVDQRAYAVYTFRDGKMAALDSYASEAEALAALSA